jgi:secreted trypsin-like serine protease
MTGRVLLIVVLVSACMDIGSEKSETKIIGGNLAAKHPFMLGLVNGDFGDRVVCGATLIRKNVAVTAAHCVEGPSKVSKVVIGTNNANSRESRTVEVRAIISHPLYKGAKGNEVFNDIAILILDDYDPTVFNTSIVPIELNRDPALPEVQGTFKVIGWGNTTSHGTLLKDELREVTMPVVPVEKCKEANHDINETQICGGDMANGGIDVCNGDSGGPLVTTKGGKLYLAGVVSWGYGCAQKGSPGVYTRVSSYVEWIEKTAYEYTEQQFEVSGSRLNNFVNNFCLSGFRSEKTVVVDQKTLSVIRTFKPGNVFVTAELFGRRESGLTLDHCDFSLPTINGGHEKVSVELIEAEGVARFEVEIGKNKYVGAAVESIGFSLKCGGTLPFALSYDPSATNLFPFGSGVYLLSENYDGELDGFISEAECSVETSSAVLLTKVGQKEDEPIRILMIKSPLFNGGFKIFKLWNLKNDRSEVAMRIASSDGKKGSISLVNESGIDIFTWRLSCNRGFILSDKNGAIFQPTKDQEEFFHEFVRPYHALGTFLSGQRIEVSFKSSDVIGRDLRCDLNGLAVDITIE